MLNDHKISLFERHLNVFILLWWEKKTFQCSAAPLLIPELPSERYMFMRGKAPKKIMHNAHIQNSTVTSIVSLAIKSKNIYVLFSTILAANVTDIIFIHLLTIPHNLRSLILGSVTEIVVVARLQDAINSVVCPFSTGIISCLMKSSQEKHHSSFNFFKTARRTALPPLSKELPLNMFIKRFSLQTVMKKVVFIVFLFTKAHKIICST